VANVGSPLSAGARLALCGGVALYLVGHAAFRLRLTGVVSYAKLAAAGACLVIFAAGARAPSWVIAGAVTATLALFVLYESAVERSSSAPL
jgi:low temperature requirement protein LtrA